MFDEIDARFGYLIRRISKYCTNIQIVKKAYQKAKELHFYQTRKDGTPYLSHPVEVAIILAKLGFMENVICAALLHDTVEDCNYSIDELKNDFGANIAQMVDCVSAIDKTKYIYDNNDIYEDPDFVKSSMEEQTFKKLIAIGKQNPYGFYIKFADRLHNLRTIQTFEYAKQLEKVRETEKWVLPITKILKAEYFYIKIKNECFKIIHKYDGENYFAQYKAYHNSNESHVMNLLLSLKILFAQDLTDVIIDELSERKVFDELLQRNKNIKIKDISQGQLLKVENYVIYLIYDSDKGNFINTILERINRELTSIKIVDAKIGSFSDYAYYVLCDDIKNKYRLYIMPKDKYQNLRIGMVDGTYNEMIDEDNVNELEIGAIRVKTRSGEIKYMQKNSTVLDFAFKIHKDIGFGFKYAIVNNSKTKLPPYTKLNENDQVEIITEKDADGEIINNASLKWLAYVNTELAKKVLIKYFEMLLQD